MSESEHLAETPTSAARALVSFFALALAARAVEKFGWDTYVDLVISAILAVALVIIAYKLPSIMNRFGKEATTKLNRIASDPKWWIIIGLVFILQGALWPFVEEKRWPFSAWFPPSPTLDQTANAIADKIRKPPSADEIANAIVGKLPRQSAIPGQTAGATPVATPYVNPLHYKDTKWKVAQGLRLWSARTDPPPNPECQITIIRYPETYSEDYAADFKEILDVVGWKYTEHLADGTLAKGISIRAFNKDEQGRTCASVLNNRLQNDGRTRSGSSLGNNLQWLTEFEASDFLKHCPSGVGCVEITFGNEDTSR